MGCSDGITEYRSQLQQHLIGLWEQSIKIYQGAGHERFALDNNPPGDEIMFSVELFSDDIAGHVKTIADSRDPAHLQDRKAELEKLALEAQPDLMDWLLARRDEFPILSSYLDISDYMRLRAIGVVNAAQKESESPGTDSV